MVSMIVSAPRIRKDGFHFESLLIVVDHAAILRLLDQECLQGPV